VYGILYADEGTDQDKITYAARHAKNVGVLKADDLVIVTAGSSHKAGSTDLIRVLSVD